MNFAGRLWCTLRTGHPLQLFVGYFAAVFLVGSASAGLAKSLVANAMQHMRETPSQTERSLTRVEHWSLYQRLAIVRRYSNQRHLVVAMMAPAQSALRLAAEMDFAELSNQPTSANTPPPSAKRMSNEGTHNVTLLANRLSNWQTRRRSSGFGIDRVAETTSDIILRSLHPG
jgi:hypothetical protein